VGVLGEAWSLHLLFVQNGEEDLGIGGFPLEIADLVQLLLDQLLGLGLLFALLV